MSETAIGNVRYLTSKLQSVYTGIDRVCFLAFVSLSQDPSVSFSPSNNNRRQPLQDELLPIAVLFSRSSPKAVPMASAHVAPHGTPSGRMRLGVRDFFAKESSDFLADIDSAIPIDRKKTLPSLHKFSED